MDLQVLRDEGTETFAFDEHSATRAVVDRFGSGILWGTFAFGEATPASRALFERMKNRTSRAFWSAMSHADVARCTLVGDVTHGRGAVVALEDAYVILHRDGSSLRSGTSLVAMRALAVKLKAQWIARDYSTPVTELETLTAIDYDSRESRGVLAYVSTTLADEKSGDVLLPQLLESHQPLLAVLEACSHFKAAGRADLVRDLEKIGQRSNAQWARLCKRAPMPDALEYDPVAELIEAGVGVAGPGVLHEWTDVQFTAPRSVALHFREGLELWRAFQPALASSLSEGLSSIAAEDAYAIALAIVTLQPESVARVGDTYAGNLVAATLRPRHAVSTALLATSTRTEMVPFLDALLTNVTPRSWVNVDEYMLIDVRDRLVPYDESYLNAIEQGFLNWNKKPKAGTELELAYVMRIFERHRPKLLAELSSDATFALMNNLSINTKWLIETLTRVKNATALMRISKCRDADYTERINAANAAAKLGHPDAAAAAATLEAQFRRALARDGM